MRLLLSAVLLAGLGLPALADQHTQLRDCKNRWSTMSATERGSMTRDEYLAQCLKNGPAAAVATAAKPAMGSMAVPPPKPLTR